ncbi:FAD-binding oxidoreductase [Nesterenkonia sp. DZ6]|uniref:FAD-binding oxidoreductase n=1 Tax=Nesterenkonia sp. DZ6 TaxID=2901229 RepID=UPI001F4C7ED4|nr:FAD-binding oxidoreductase [Nesterenkonia sp. DZ6]MCH8559726.1 FAD-binding oxidoreductase [Nesterenkonia sp. DZ6]
MDTDRDLDQSLQELRSSLSGVVIEPDHPLYEDARRVWNGMVDVHPRAVVRAGSIADVEPVLDLAQRTGTPLAVRGGGHNVAGHGTVEAGLVLDLSLLRGVDVNAETQIVTVEPGATLADVDAATVPHGLAVPLGVISATGVAGLTLGGGVGWLTRACGLTLDNLISAEVITSNLEHVHADAQNSPDLFWALRGGGGNFGLVTSFVYRAQRLPEQVLGGNLVYGRPHWRQALQAFARWTEDLPDEMTSILSIIRLPSEYGVGEEPVLVIGVAWVGADLDEGSRLVDRLREHAPPDAEEIEPVQWLAWQSAMDGLFPKGARGYWKNASFSRLDDEVIDALLEIAGELTWIGTGFDIHHMDGAFGRVAENATAFPNRSARYWLNIYGFWQDPSEDSRLTAFARRAHAAVEPHADDGQYVNFLGAEHETDPTGAVQEVYGGHKTRRLIEIKTRYDPTNLFRLNHNIRPASV